MRRGLIFGVLIAIVSLAAIALLCFRPALVTGTSEKSLAYSLRQANDASETGACRGADEKWACSVFSSGDDSSADPAVYDIDVDNWGCWDAERRGGGGGDAAPGTLDGCITILDLIRADD